MERIAEVTDVQLESEGYNLLVKAEGKSDGSSCAGFALAPRAYEGGPPEDGVLDLDFVAAPEGGGDETGAASLPLENIENFWNGAHRLKGVRVHAATNDREIMLP